MADKGFQAEVGRCREGRSTVIMSFNIQTNMSQKKRTEENGGVEIIQELEHFPKLSEKHIYKGPLTTQWMDGREKSKNKTNKKRRPICIR